MRGIALSILVVGFAHFVHYRQAHGGEPVHNIEAGIVLILFISAIGCIAFGI